MHYFLLIYCNSKPLYVSSRLAPHLEEVQLRILPAASQHNTLLYQLLFIQSWSSCWWAASLLRTCRGLLL